MDTYDGGSKLTVEKLCHQVACPLSAKVPSPVEQMVHAQRHQLLSMQLERAEYGKILHPYIRMERKGLERKRGKRKRGLER